MDESIGPSARASADGTPVPLDYARPGPYPDPMFLPAVEAAIDAGATPRAVAAMFPSSPAVAAYLTCALARRFPVGARHTGCVDCGDPTARRWLVAEWGFVVPFRGHGLSRRNGRVDGAARTAHVFCAACADHHLRSARRHVALRIGAASQRRWACRWSSPPRRSRAGAPCPR